MGMFFGVILSIWFWSALLVATPYFWFKRTNRSQSPIERRIRAFCLGLGWPYFVIKHFTGKSEAEAAERDRQAAADRIIGGAPPIPRQGGQPATPATPPAAASGPPPAPPAAAGGSGSRIANPFDNL